MAFGLACPILYVGPESCRAAGVKPRGRVMRSVPLRFCISSRIKGSDAAAGPPRNRAANGGLPRDGHSNDGQEDRT